jgi:aspartyl-tRNA(Asn)/glutamyl-tRNA(Gln) amidotransferase subunit A
LNTALPALARSLARREISSVELTQLYLDRIARHNAQLNAYLTVDADQSLMQARAADERLARGEGGPLTGIPIAHKDIFCARGWLTTCGSRMLGNFVSPYDAAVIARFAAAGAVLLGKTNMDEFAMGSSNETSFFGPVKNPWDTTCVPGGSSGGSAAAVAARLAPAATGTDTGGSIRQPAALCNLTGMKPTYGVISRYGMIAFASSLDQAGPLGRSAADCAVLLNGMAGFDERDSTSLDRPPEDYGRALDAATGAKPLAGLKIGLPAEFFGPGCSPEVMRWSRRQSPSTAGLAPKRSPSACRAWICRWRPTTSSHRPKPARTSRVLTACVTATARRLMKTSTTCTARAAPRASAPKSSAAS